MPVGKVVPISVATLDVALAADVLAMPVNVVMLPVSLIPRNSTPPSRANRASYVLGNNVLVIECVCSPDEAKRRMSQRPKSDGLISDPNNPKVYEKLAGLWEDVMQNDFKYPGSDHVSYITYNTETKEIQVKFAPNGYELFMNNIKNILQNVGPDIK